MAPIAKSGIWKGLYEFPFLESFDNVNQNTLILSKGWIHMFGNEDVDIKCVSREFIHLLSHQKIHAKFWTVQIDQINLKNYQLVSKKELEKYPVSRLTEKYFETIELT